jgi:hypothetical protein
MTPRQHALLIAELGDRRVAAALDDENGSHDDPRTQDERLGAIVARFDAAEARRRSERFRPAILRVADALHRINAGSA